MGSKSVAAFCVVLCKQRFCCAPSHTESAPGVPTPRKISRDRAKTKLYSLNSSQNSSRTCGFFAKGLTHLFIYTFEFAGTDSVTKAFPPITEFVPILVSPPKIVAPAR